MLRRLVPAWSRVAASRHCLSTTAAAASKADAQPAMSASDTPMEDAIRAKINDALKPTRLEIFNDSHKHAHHKAMAGSTSRETHFRLVVASDAFASARFQPARHRIIYQLLKDEMAREGGIHALQLRTMTPEEDEKRAAAE